VTVTLEEGTGSVAEEQEAAADTTAKGDDGDLGARRERQSDLPPWWVTYVGVIVGCLAIGAVISVLGGNYAAGAAVEGTIIFWAIVLIPVGRRGGRWAGARRAERLTQRRTSDRE
jgi:hypothetical protein